MKFREDDIELLLPTFREAVKRVLEELREGGYSPVLFDGLRTAEEALRNARRGKGIVASMHLYGCAADVICAEHGWGCAKAGHDFFDALGRAAERQKCTWGGRWPKRDMPHFQGVPLRLQDRMRALGVGSERAKERDELVRKALA